MQAYISGFFDGNGSVSFSWGSKTYHGKKNTWPRIQIVFSNADKNLLSFVQKILGVGTIDTTKLTPSRKPYWSPMSHLRITSMDDLQKTVEYLLSYSRSKKEQLLLCKETVENLLSFKKSKYSRWSDESKVYFEQQQKKIAVFNPRSSVK